MQTFWDQELTSEEADQLIGRVAALIGKRHMETPAIFALEMHRPVMGIAAQGMIAFSPFLVPFVGFDNVNDYSRLLAKREYVERLIQRLEEARELPPKES